MVDTIKQNKLTALEDLYHNYAVLGSLMGKNLIIKGGNGCNLSKGER